MGLPVSNPENWTKSDRQRAVKGELVFYEGTAREAIDVVAEQIRSYCGGDDKNFITVLPIELYYEGKLYELPLFRIKRHVHSKVYYVDNIARCYGSYTDWYEYNKLPPGEMAFPTSLKLSLKSGSKEAKVLFGTTPTSRLDAKAARGLDTVAAFAGLGSSVALLFVSGGLAAPLVVTTLVTAGWGTTDISSDTMLKDGKLILGRAPPINITDLPQLSPPMIRFIGDLSQMDATSSRLWSSSVPILLSLQKQGSLTLCPVAKIISGGNAIVSLNSVLNISIHKLNSMPADDCKNLLQIVAKMPSTVTSNQLSKEVKTLCVVNHRLRFERQRNESITVAAKFLENHKALQNFVKSNNLMSHEKDRSYTFVNTIAMNKADSYTNDMLAFVNVTKSTSTSELVAYSEFVINTISDECVRIKMNVKNGSTVLPNDTKLSVWTRKEARKNVFGDRTLLSRNFTRTLQMVRDNKMVGVIEVANGMSDLDSIRVIRQRDIKFASEASATYHAAKHPTSPPSAYVSRANRTIRASQYSASVGQDGDVRNITFDDGQWSATILERDGTVLLCTYMPNR